MLAKKSFPLQKNKAIRWSAASENRFLGEASQELKQF